MRMGKPGGAQGGRWAEHARSVPAWVVFVGALFIALGAAYVLAELRNRTDDDREALVMLVTLQAQAYRLSAVEWQVVAEGRLTPKSAEEARAANERMSRALEGIGGLRLEQDEREAHGRVREAVRRYSAAVDRELGLFEAGRIERALAVDEEEVDPSFEDMSAVLREAEGVFYADARAGSRLINLGSTLTLLLSAALISWLFWAYERTRRAAENLRTANLEERASRLRESNRELQDFVRVASHDLQEPLRKVRVLGERLRGKYAEALDERGRDYLRRMEASTARMQDLIEDLLALSRVTTRARPFEAVDLGEAAREAVSDLQARIEETGGRVEVGDLPTVEADRAQMRQMFQNLIANALKFHREGRPPRVRVYGEVSEEPDGALTYGPPGGKVCRVCVEDEGIGFEEEHAARIFAPFERLHGRGAYEGTGMGLAICRRVAERHGGRITARGEPGRGATFVVTLPVKRRADEHTEGGDGAERYVAAG